MISRTYKMKLSNHKIFQDLRESLRENSSGKLRNLLELRDDVLYVWNSIENCLSSLNLKHLEEHDEETPYQKLHLLSAPQFSVERITVSVCGGRVCVWGSRGVTVVELPTRWGRGGLFDNGSETVLCKSFSLDERFLFSGEVRSVQWHQSSLSHLWVLVCDNTIRLYSVALKSGPKLVKIFAIGPKPSGLLASRPLLDSLGDTAVDFTATPGSDSLLILRGNGDVYMMECDLEAKTLQLKLKGPLAMYPPADDNYGSESCSIIALSNSSDMPPLVVVATCSAQLYHCLLLPNATDTGNDSHALYVVEAVELSIVLNPDDNIDLQHSYPVHLYPCANNTYACMHAGGVHTVTLPVLNNLQDYALADDASSETELSGLLSRASVARHLVCTAGPRADLRPPVGLALTTPPLPSLLVLCTDATLLSRTLEPYDLEEQLYKQLQLRNPALEQDDINNILKERQKLSFTAIIHELLTREVSQPLLNIQSEEEPSSRESLEFLTLAALKLRGEYMTRQQRAADAIKTKLAALRALSTQHAVWHRDMQKDIDDVTIKTDILKKKCLLAEKHQEDIKHRCSAVVRKLRASAPATPAERELLAELERHKRSGELLAEQIQRLRQYARNKQDEFKKWQNEYKRKDIALGKSHKDTISSILQQQTTKIAKLVEETKLLKDQLSIV